MEERVKMNCRCGWLTETRETGCGVAPSWAAVSLMCVVAIVLGCNSEPEGAHITGTVTFGGAPIPQATIVFRPTAQLTGSSTEAQVTEGTFDVRQETGVFGLHRVEIYAHRPLANPPPTPPGPLPPGQQPPATTQQYLPERYNRQSRLTFTIEPGENEAMFELTR